MRLARGIVRDGLRAHLGRLPLFRDWRPVEVRDLHLAGLDHIAVSDLAVLKLGAAALALVIALALQLPPICVAPLGFAAFVAPSEWVGRRARSAQESREAGLLPWLEGVLALGAAGMTVEQALSHSAETDTPLGFALREAVARSRLGVPPFDALADVAARERLSALAEIALELGGARRSGRPMLPLLAERREIARLASRARRLEAASRVDGALSLVLVGAYLPALLLLVVVPLFLGLLRSLEG
ncbi:MAG: hypothetical protein E6I87_06850 [Chloroflexi bacterium]|nr:MAG: hypothetical protein E6I87_06850 [Chloroflexota bacterium]